MSVPDSSSWKDNVGWGIAWSLAPTTLYCSYAVLVYVLRGSAPFEANDTTLLAVLGAYIAGGIVVGVIVGSLRPFTRSWTGAVVLGFFAALPVFAAIRVAVDGLSHWTAQDLTGIVGLSVALGPFGGIVFRYYGRKLKRELEEEAAEEAEQKRSS